MFFFCHTIDNSVLRTKIYVLPFLPVFFLANEYYVLQGNKYCNLNKLHMYLLFNYTLQPSLSSSQTLISLKGSDFVNIFLPEQRSTVLCKST